MNKRIPVAIVATTILLGTAVAARPTFAQDSTPGVPLAEDTAYTAGEYRVFTGAGEPATLEDIIAAMGPNAAVFIGETHDDPTQHMLEAELLKRAYEAYGDPATAGASARPVALSLEFFQRDTQEIVDEYLAGLITDKAFQADGRPWPRYDTDYRPLIEFAKEHGLTVIAANAPRRYANRVTRLGRESLDELSPEALASLPPLPYGTALEAYRNQWIQVISEVMEEEGMKCGIPVEQLAAEGEEAVARAPAGAHGNMGNQMDSQVLWDAFDGVLDFRVPGAGPRRSGAPHGRRIPRRARYRDARAPRGIPPRYEPPDRFHAGGRGHRHVRSRSGGRVGRLRHPDRRVPDARGDRVPAVPGRAGSSK